MKDCLPASDIMIKVFVLRLGVVVVVVEDLLRTSLLMKERKEYTTAVLLIYLSGHLDHQPGDSRTMLDCAFMTYFQK